MHKSSAHSLIAMALVANLWLLSAASPSIGVALANGNISIDKTRTPGNAPLFEGDTVETDKVSSRLQLNNGVRVVLGSDSKGTIYRDRLVLQEGATQVDTHGKYDVSARFLRITGTEPNSSTRIRMRGPTVQVASLSGTVQVANAHGVLLTRIAPGMAFDFTQLQSQYDLKSHGPYAGILQKQGDDYLLTDDTSKVTYQLIGDVPKSKVGKTISVYGDVVEGQAPVAGADKVLRIDSTKKGGGAAAGATAGAGVSHGTAIIAGIVLVAATATTVGVLATSGESSPNQTVSPARP